MSKLNDIVQKTLETAKTLGAQNARVEMTRTQRLQIEWKKNRIDKMYSAGKSSLNIQLFVDGRYGTFRTSDLRPDAIKAFLEKGIAMTRQLEEEPAYQLANPERYKNRPNIDLDMYDQKIVDFTPNQAIERCKALEDEFFKHDKYPIIGVKVNSNTILKESLMMSSNGFEGSFKSTSIKNGGSIHYSDGDKKVGCGDSSTTVHLEDLKSPKDIADNAMKFLEYKFGQKKLPSKTRTIVFDRDAAEGLINYYLVPLAGTLLVRKQSYFANKIGQPIASKLFDLHDNPLIVRGRNSRLYDDEGMSSRESTLFENGVLKQYLLNVYAANKLGMEPTSGSTSNILMTPGKRSVEEIIADVKDGLYVYEFGGGDQDNTQGIFSFGMSGVAIENGKLTVPFSNMNFNGNHLEFWKNLTEVGNDPNPAYIMRIPCLRIDNVSTSGI